MRKENGILMSVQPEDLELLNSNPDEFWRGVESIGDDAFSGCKSLKSIVIPEGVASIGDDVFYGCESLKSIVIPEGVESIGYGAFYGCESLESIVIPEGVKSIGDGAFNFCESLESIVIPEGVESIGYGAFYGCESLESMVIPEGVESIGKSAFYGCKSLKSIVIPEGVENIGEGALYGCESLESIVIPESVENIGDDAFYGCKSLEFIEFCGIKIPSKEYFQREILQFLLHNKERKEDFKKLDIINLCYSINDFGLDLNEVSLDDVQTFEFSQWNKITKLIKAEHDSAYVTGRGDLLKFAKLLGLFDKEATVEIKNSQGKVQKEKVCDRAFNFLQKFVKDVEITKMHRFLQGMQADDFSEEFLKFVSDKTNYSAIIERLNSNDDFLNLTYAWFRNRDKLDLQQVSALDPFLPQAEQNRYKIKTIKPGPDGVEREHWNQPTVDLLIKEFSSRKYRGINTARDNEIAQQFTEHTQYDQKHFDKAKEIDAEREQAGVPDFIVGVQIKSNKTQAYAKLLSSEEKENYFEQTENLREQIVGEAAEALWAQKDVSDRIFTYETLAKSDIANFYIGQLTNCCARLYGAGSGAMRAAILSPDMQPLVVRNDRDEIVAYSIMYINRQEGYAVLNDIEVNHRYNSEDLEKSALIYEAMKECAVKNIEQFNKTAPVKVKILTSGTSPNGPKINEVISKNRSTQTFKAPDFSDYSYVGAAGAWRGDWHGGQYLIWSADENEAQREDVCKN